MKILEEQFAKRYHKSILLIYSQYDHEYPSLVFISLAIFKLQLHKLVKHWKENICSYHFIVLKQHGRILYGRKSYFANANKACQYHFKQYVNVQLFVIGQLMTCNFENDFSCNGKADGFCVEKRLFGAFDEKVEQRLFERL